MSFCRHLVAHSPALLLFVVLLSGCGTSNNSARYIPPPALSEVALAAALTAWRDGIPTPIKLEDKTTVEVVDQSRRSGQLLKEFNILGEVSRDAGRCFEVQLHLDHPEQVEQVRYLVIGINPLWVYRQTDYEMFFHWDHAMPAQGTTPSKDAAQAPVNDETDF